MKFVCEQDRLNRMLSMVNHAVARGAGAFPMATNIRIMSDEENRIRLDATNLSIGITGWIEATITEEGNVAVPAKLFTDLIGALTPGKIEISVDNTTYDVQVKGPRGPVHVRGLDPEEFPPMPGPELSVKPTLLKSALLKEVIREVSIAVDDGGVRNEVFSNILLQIEQQRITFAAADGYGKLAFRTLPLPAESALTSDILVPARSLTELASILPTDGMVEIRLTPNNSQVIFSTQWMVLSSILSSGSFPNYKAALPREKQTSVTIKTADLREIVQLASLFAKSDYDAGHLTIKSSMGVEPGTLQLASEAADVGGAAPTIPVAVEGDDQEALIFNVSHIAKVLGVISAPELIFEVGMTRAPVGVMRPTGSHTCVHSFSSMGAAR
ncbi:DNA polymerase III subunit beta [Dictyobacter alpinus]|uniref:DNA polymerase III subunit beta n=2 Tax=Dictyobacter alpinus TaxID=2014873 RepID=A0A402BL03_9CHLR|nr:DNA polymerase III subunit beta [Dictyobacter alpinus]